MNRLLLIAALFTCMHCAKTSLPEGRSPTKSEQELYLSRAAQSVLRVRDNSASFLECRIFIRDAVGYVAMAGKTIKDLGIGIVDEAAWVKNAQKVCAENQARRMIESLREDAFTSEKGPRSGEFRVSYLREFLKAWEIETSDFGSSVAELVFLERTEALRYATVCLNLAKTAVDNQNLAWGLRCVFKHLASAQATPSEIGTTAQELRALWLKTKTQPTTPTPQSQPSPRPPNVKGI